MIYLKYGIYSGTSLSWSSTGEFNELQCIDTIETGRIQGRSLRGIEFNHLLSKRTNYKIVISADELYNESQLAFIKSFYTAHAWQLSLDDSDYIEYNLKEEGDMPNELVEDSKFLPEITFNLMQKVPD